jgi:hypothetical protein
MQRNRAQRKREGEAMERYHVVRSSDRRTFSETVESFETLADAAARLGGLIRQNAADLESNVQATRHDAQGWDFYVWDEIENTVAA